MEQQTISKQFLRQYFFPVSASWSACSAGDPAGACNLIDYSTGLMASKYRAQDINSYKSIRGIFKKVSMWLLVVVGAIIDEMLLYASTSIGWKSPVTFLVACVVAMWLICNEIISILENIQDMGVNIPAFMQPLVKHIRSQVEDQVKVDNDSEGE